MSIIRVGLAENGKFGEGWEAIFGKHPKDGAEEAAGKEDKPAKEEAKKKNGKEKKKK